MVVGRRIGTSRWRRQAASRRRLRFLHESRAAAHKPPGLLRLGYPVPHSISPARSGTDRWMIQALRFVKQVIALERDQTGLMRLSYHRVHRSLPWHRHKSMQSHAGASTTRRSTARASTYALLLNLTLRSLQPAFPPPAWPTYTSLRETLTTRVGATSRRLRASPALLRSCASDAL